MKETERLRVEPGIIRGNATMKRASGVTTNAVRWNVPLMSNDELGLLLRALAEDLCFAGRWLGGGVTEEDRLRAGVTERGWASACDCAMRQPCRHAQTVLFQFRQEAKADPWLWLAARGAGRDESWAAVRKLRADIRRSSPFAAAEEAAVEAAIARTLRSHGDAATSDVPLLPHMENPAFWNRDIAFAQWLRPIYRAVRKEGNRDKESDGALDSNLFERL